MNGAEQIFLFVCGGGGEGDIIGSSFPMDMDDIASAVASRAEQ